MNLLVEKYRPTSIKNIVLDPEVRNKVESYINKKSIPNLIFYGKAGTGKTSLTNILIKELNADYESYNASEKRGIDFIRDEVMQFVDKISVSESGLKIVDLREADELTPNAQKALKDIIESNSDDTRFIFSTNNIGKIIPEIISRCEVIHIQPDDDIEVAKYIWNIVQTERIITTKKDVFLLVKKYFPDIRKIIMSLESSLDSKNQYKFLNTDIYSNTYQQIFDLLSNFLKNSKKTKQTVIYTYKEIRQLLLSMSESQLFSFYIELNNWLDNNISDDTFIECKLILADKHYKFQSQIDKELITSSMILEILNTYI